MHVVGIDPAIAVNGKICDACTKPLQKPARVDDCRMLHLGGDEVAVGDLFLEVNTLEGVIVGFAAAARKNDFAGVAVQQMCYLAPGLLYGFPCGYPCPVVTGRITEGSSSTARIAEATSGATGVLALKSR